MTNLKKIISIKDYKTFAGKDWPSYDDIINNVPASTPYIQSEVNNFIKIMNENYNAITLSGDILAKENQKRQNQIFFNKNYKNKNYCRIPWNTLGVNSNGDLYICSSPSWIPKFIGNLLKTTNIYDTLNSPTAQSIRQEILTGRYFYCNNKICNFFEKINPNEYNSLPTVNNLEPLKYESKEETTILTIPKNLIFDFDYTCNLKCPSCRTELINNNKHHIIRPINDEIVEKIKVLIIDNIKNQPIEIRWCGGEPFISDVYLNLLEYITSLKKNNIKHIIQTNGSYLLNKFDLVSELLPNVSELRISFDAASSDTYKKVRVNGVWDTLITNVRHVNNYIKDNNLRTVVTADFVVQYDNYTEIPAFVNLCNTLGIKNINFTKMWNWGTWPQEEFDRKNIFNTSHPEYFKLVEMFKQANRKISY